MKFMDWRDTTHFSKFEIRGGVFEGLFNPAGSPGGHQGLYEFLQQPQTPSEPWLPDAGQYLPWVNIRG